MVASVYQSRFSIMTPGVAGSLQVEEFRAPQPGPDQLLVRAVALGVCGTDRDIVDGQYGSAPLDRFHDALEKRPHDVKTIIEFGA